MKRSTLSLLFFASVFYFVALSLFRNIVPQSSLSTLPLLALPLLALAIIVALELRHRSVAPVELKKKQSAGRLRARDVRFLTRQLEVAGTASPSYFNTVIRSRLRDLLAEKVSLETGMEFGNVKTTLADPKLGPLLLKNSRTYALLYYPPPQGAATRLQMLREIIDSIEGWIA